METPAPSPAQIADALHRYYGLPHGKAQALATAGIEQIRSPYSVPGMEPLVERIVQALQRQEPILVFGDFDADGITGSAILFQTLMAFGGHVHRYNPFYDEGYGLHPDQVERFAGLGVRLVMTVDSGITSHEGIDRARQLGLEVLVTDHHLPPQPLGPPDTIWIDPLDHLLSGAQLAYLVAWALRQRLDGATDHDPWGLALSAIGAQADMVPVDEPETRAWVAQALAIINSPHCPSGLQALKEIHGQHYIRSEMFVLAGLLNMGKRSRLVDPNTIVEALLPETSAERRRQVFQFLHRESARTRKAVEELTARVLEDVRGEIGRDGLLIYEVSVPDETLSEVEGPLTSRIVQVTGRPAIVLRTSGDRINFAGRAGGTFSFESFMGEPEICSLVLAMGGHRQAIGGSFRPQERQAFLAAVHRWEQRQPPFDAASPSRPRVHPLAQLDPETAYLLGRAIGPFGHHLEPLRFSTNLSVRGGWAFSGDHLVELDRPPWDGEWHVVFRFDEAGCDGQKVTLRVNHARRLES